MDGQNKLTPICDHTILHEYEVSYLTMKVLYSTVKESLFHGQWEPRFCHVYTKAI